MRHALGKMTLCGVLLLMTLAHTAMAAPVHIEGTRAALEPPPHFESSSTFPGFERSDLQATIMVTQLPAPVSHMISGMTPAALASRGMTVLSAIDVQAKGGSARLLDVRQTSGPTTVAKWMLIGGDEQSTVLAVATFPLENAAKVSDSARRSLLSLSWNTVAAGDPLAGVRFRLQAVDGLKIAGQLANLMLLNESGAMPAPDAPVDPGAPFYIAGHEPTGVVATNPAEFARAVAKRTANLVDIGHFKERETRLDGSPAVEILAEARDRRTGRPTSLYQVTSIEETGYFVVKGIVASDRFDLALPSFRRLTESIRRDAKVAAAALSAPVH